METILHKETILENIPKLISEEDNNALDQPPSIEEIHRVIEEMDGSSAIGPDGFTGFFYKTCWKIIKTDFFEAVCDFLQVLICLDPGQAHLLFQFQELNVHLNSSIWDQ